MRSPEPGRNALLDAGQRLLGSADLARISVNSIVAEAGMAKGSFYQHWPSRAEYVRALHARFHDELEESIAAAMADLPPGRDRLEAGMNAYLDGCLAEPATKALLVQSRTEAGLSDLVAARNESAAAQIAARSGRARMGAPGTGRRIARRGGRRDRLDRACRR